VTREQTLDKAQQLLATRNIEDAAIEAEVILMHVLNIKRSQLYCEPWEELSTQQSAEFWHDIERRLNNEPSAYITGHREFYGLDFIVDPSVLIPRPETELLVEKTIELATGHNQPVIVDVGTGSGAIAVSLAVHLAKAQIYATDISAPALEVTRRNAAFHGVADRVVLLQGDLLEPITFPVDIIVANLPYVTRADLASVNTIGHEPVLALDGGDDGLDIVRRLCGQASQKLAAGGKMLLETGIGQALMLKELLNGIFPDAQIEILQDMSGIDRVVLVSLKTSRRR